MSIERCSMLQHADAGTHVLPTHDMCIHLRTKSLANVSQGCLNDHLAMTLHSDQLSCTSKKPFRFAFDQSFIKH